MTTAHAVLLKRGYIMFTISPNYLPQLYHFTEHYVRTLHTDNYYFSYRVAAAVALKRSVEALVSLDFDSAEIQFPEVPATARAKRERQDKKVGENCSCDPTQPISEYSLLPHQYQNIAHQRAQCLNHPLTFLFAEQRQRLLSVLLIVLLIV